MSDTSYTVMFLLARIRCMIWFSIRKQTKKGIIYKNIEESLFVSVAWLSLSAVIWFHLIALRTL